MGCTLALAWEFHVFGSATLFILMAGLAVLGVAGACTRPRPLCEALILANSLLMLGGTLRGAVLLLDPYGTRGILPRATLTALHNVPLLILLWAQVFIALTISLCLGLLFCMGILIMSFYSLHPSLRSPVPQCVSSQRIEKCAKQVTAVCAFFGFLCCSLHMYGLLWLYGLLGNWRYFGWGWWLISVTTDYNRSVRSPADAVMHLHDWSEEDVTGL
ncbi:hypothetical protein CesoFtcFv8_002359 [Champsocephalus esox]|uniref:Proline-rich transmembrane protein 3/4 domain-containing protein n=1 Tax=Champsocephalus esox TaxID=159716 RepID=A0AAN8CXR9_9TELE|nr:hypothetical protein CesoFtcFv8_002359 [Champsocephalus esox]